MTDKFISVTEHQDRIIRALERVAVAIEGKELEDWMFKARYGVGGDDAAFARLEEWFYSTQVPKKFPTRDALVDAIIDRFQEYRFAVDTLDKYRPSPINYNDGCNGQR